jgi:hypothetical protein
MADDVTESDRSDPSGDHRGYLAVRAVAAGAIGLLLQFGVLSVAGSLGLFTLDSLARLGGPVLGAVVFVGAGLAVWPTLFGAFARRIDRGPLVAGLAFGLVLWPLFTLLFAPAGAATADLALYALFGLAAHALYGFGIGVVFALLGPTPDTARAALAQLFASTGEESTSGPTAGSADAGTDSPDPSTRAAAATASADAAEGTTSRSRSRSGGRPSPSPNGSTTTGTTDTAPPGTASTSGSGGATAPDTDAEPEPPTAPAAADADADADTDTDTEPEPTALGGSDAESAVSGPPVPGDGIVRPEDLPPLLDFEQALSRIRPHLDSGAAAEQFALIEDEYERLKGRGAEGRHPIVSDMANHLAGLRERLPRDSPARKWVDSMDNRVSMYLRSGHRPSDTLHLVGVQLLDGNGDPAEVTDLREKAARIRATVVNGGERSGAVAIVTFRHENGVLLRSVDLSMGYVGAGERKTLDTTVYVPSIASSFEVRAAAPEDGRQFLPEL